MSAKIREVEVKYRIADAEAVIEALESRGATWSAPVCQDDQAYAPAGWDYSRSKLGVAFARLRTQDGCCVFTVKVPRANEMACVEHETLVADRDQMHQAITAMGYAPTVRIVKTRRAARLGDMQFCLDEVEHAGTFLEIETTLHDYSEAELAVQTRLDDFATSLGITTQRVRDTYDSLVRASLAAA